MLNLRSYFVTIFVTKQTSIEQLILARYQFITDLLSIVGGHDIRDHGLDVERVIK